MKHYTKLSAGALALMLAASSAGADDRTTPVRSGERDARGSIGALTADSKREIQETARQAASVFQKFVSSKSISDEQLNKAKCVAVFPEVTQVALGVGGSHGDGLISCRSATGWSNAAPLDISGASIGAQLGAKKTDMVLLLTTEKARRQIESGTLTLGANGSFVASTEDRKAMELELSTKNPDVIAYVQERGLFAGASLNGTGVRIDADEVRNLYGKELQNSDLLSSVNKDTSPAVTREFVQALPKI